MQKELSMNDVQDIASKELSGSISTQMTQKASSITSEYDPEWAKRLHDKYGIVQPMIEDFE